MEERISMVHGSGGAATSELIGAIFAKESAWNVVVCKTKHMEMIINKTIFLAIKYSLLYSWDSSVFCVLFSVLSSETSSV